MGKTIVKLAELGDLRRKLERTRPVNGATRIENNGNNIEFHLVNSLCGLNGSGKTRILKSIALDENPSNLEDFIFHKNGEGRLYISPSILISETIRKSIELKKSPNYTDEVDQYDPYDFTPDQIDKVNYIIHSTFSEISIYEIETLVDLNGLDDNAENNEPLQNSEIFPYCTAKKNSSLLDSESLSQGELYVILLIWLLTTNEELCLALIDEPETFLSPLAQTRLGHVLIQISVQPRDRNIQIIAATHSPFILESIGYKNSLSVSRFPNTLSITTADKSLLSKIGLHQDNQNIILVEDAKAKLLLEEILNRFIPAWTHNNVVMFCNNGESDLQEIYKRIGGPQDKGKVLLVYDADIIKTKRFSAEEERYSLILPGSEAPEIEVIKHLHAHTQDILNLFTPERRERLIHAMEGAAGLDHHDYFITISRDSKIHEQEIFNTIASHWCSEHEKECHDFIQKYLNLI
ncbi:TPA: hypothetical protein L6B67_00655 [Pseudomonas aeruginosa]|nr:AAA family ATPase [Pseudomonas aeruginosa]HBP5443639.1 hypothetical protein [Pseudomonas aeruginosa]